MEKTSTLANDMNQAYDGLHKALQYLDMNYIGKTKNEIKKVIKRLERIRPHLRHKHKPPWSLRNKSDKENNMKIKLSKNQWEFIGKKTGWMRKAEHPKDFVYLPEDFASAIYSYFSHKSDFSPREIILKAREEIEKIRSSHKVIEKEGDEESYRIIEQFTVENDDLRKYLIDSLGISSQSEHGQRDDASGEILPGVEFSKSFMEFQGDKLIVKTSGGLNI